MPVQDQNQNTFYVGLCMAGAVSAGAYTAGVMDYLLEALAIWEGERLKDGVPRHRVQIPVMGGASAGAMTSILAAASLNNKLPPINKPGGDLLAEHPENKLYHSWVDLTGVDMLSQMLDTSDIQNGTVLSVLNSNFIDPIAQRVVTVDTTPGNWLNLPEFIMPGMKVFATLSNLQGFDYTVDFNSADPQTNKYTMVIHNDYACFQLTDGAITGANDGWMPLNLKEGTNRDIAASAAMATGAFPVGLKSRLLDRQSLYVSANPWLKDYIATNPLTDPNCNTLNIDGGMINNEPFEKVRDVLTALTGQQSPAFEDYNQFTSTVLMIEPFPTKASEPISKLQALLHVIGLTFSTMLSQMRSKPVHFKDALHDECAGQYLITPSRKLDGPDGTDMVGEQAIACGALNGFSGFINKEFRVHDYFLGRYNCKIFLRDYFTIPRSAIDTNDIFRSGYENVDLSKFKSTHDDSYQIIPVFADKTDYTFPDFKFSSGSNWPVLQESDIDRYHDAIKTRLKSVLPNLFKLSWFQKTFVSIVGFLGLYNVLTNKSIKTIKKALWAWKLLPGEPPVDS